MDGSSYAKAVPEGRTPTLLEQQGIGEESTAGQYCQAIQRYLLGRDHPLFVDEITMLHVMGSRRVVPGFVVDLV